MRFDLYRLGPREFENLAQTIAVSEIGPEVVVYGAGSDGGREATHLDHASNRYVVLQAKYKEKQETARAEATWLISELRKEFKDWRDSAKRGRKPDHFIVATNVTLSATPKSGGIDRLHSFMEVECRKLGIASWTIWHAENFNRFLEKHDGIRTAYAAWVLPGDILSTLYEQVSRRESDVAQAMKTYLAKELLNDRYANLDQAGSADDRKIPLADIFFDVPIGPHYDHHQGKEAYCIETLVAACNTKHSPADTADALDSGRGERDRLRASNRFVLVGGPGQGKSTVSQFLCQLYRAQLVRESISMRNLEVRAAVKQIDSQADREGMIPKARRWPVNVPLTRFADELARGGCRNIPDYIASRVSEASGVSVTAENIRDWLKVFPWLVVLDGLDEVPSSSNRAEVLTHISAFQLEADELNADVVMVATTRPQGYTDDFSPQHYRHHVLMPLSRESALGYGRKLAVARYGTGSDRVNQLMMRLERAADETSTAHLMKTPLQVTIMAVLLDRVGKAPKDRYTLFADYYRVIYERELEKEGAASNLLRDHKTDIDAIHADVGLLLQHRSERSGETESRLTVEELNRVISDRLASEGHEGDGLVKLTSAISRAATDRLVFLVPSRGGEVSFEIRSLQEFWAADALLNCAEDEISRRLRLMSVSSHWRNVLLFTLGNIFATRRNNLRDSVVALVAELNSYSEEFGSVNRRVLMGSRLAVEILHDGMVRAPRYEATLLEESLKLLRLPPSESIPMLTSSLSERGRAISRDFIEAQQMETDATLLVFLGIRVSHGDEWAEGKLKSIFLAADDDKKVDIWELGLAQEVPALILLASPGMAEPQLTARMAALVPILETVSHGALAEPIGHLSGPKWLPDISRFFSSHRYAFRRASSNSIAGINGLQSVFDCPEPLSATFASGFPASHWLGAVKRLCETPNSANLAEFTELAGPYAEDVVNLAEYLPWISRYALELYRDEGPAALELIKQGYLGDRDDWHSIEESLAGLELIDLARTMDDWREDGRPFAPLSVVNMGGFRHRPSASLPSEEQMRSAVELCCQLPDGSHRSSLAKILLENIAISSIRNKIELTLALPLVNLLPKSRFISLYWMAELNSDQIVRWMDFFEELGRVISVGHVWFPVSIPPEVMNIFADDDSKIGLGRIASNRFEKGALPEGTIARISRAWEIAKGDDSISVERKEILAILVSQLYPPSSAEEIRDRIDLLLQSVSERRCSLDLLMHSIRLDQGNESREFMLRFLEADGLSRYEAEAVIARVVRLQLSAGTAIDFDSMRPS
ncbi:NACHT domain-containing protein [Streptomyces virginiae]|uniref:NACHT domain-containing protein n=1 Tax=Streptomyces virginiae TaxID=1961 RepID=UPI00381C7134